LSRAVEDILPKNRLANEKQKIKNKTFQYAAIHLLNIGKKDLVKMTMPHHPKAVRHLDNLFLLYDLKRYNAFLRLPFFSSEAGNNVAFTMVGRPN